MLTIPSNLLKNIQEAKDPDLRASQAAMIRAAESARKIAIQTGTNLIVVKDGQLTRIPAHVLREAVPPAVLQNPITESSRPFS
jgi:hypothetical protein